MSLARLIQHVGPPGPHYPAIMAGKKKKVQENQRQKTQVAVVGAILACVVDFVLVLQHTPRIVSVLVVRCGEHVVMCLSM